jgi:uncharacterized protein
MKRILHILFLGCLLTTAAVAQYEVATVPNPKTANANASVSNPDGILSIETVDSLNLQLYALERETSAEVAVVIVNSIGDNEIEDFATTLFNRWGIGKADKDNGVLVLFVLDQKAVRLEIGYGLEGVLPDAICKRIQTQAMMPEFKNERYDAGILAGLNMMIKFIKNEPVPDEMETSEDIDWAAALFKALLFFVIVALFSRLWMSQKIDAIVKNEKYEDSISRCNAIKTHKNTALGCLSFCVFILALIVFFDWKIQIVLPWVGAILGFLPVNTWTKQQMWKIRQTPIPCETCGGIMHILPKKEENRCLSDSQQMEVKFRALEYDIFECDICKNVKYLIFDLPSKYSTCPNCNAKTFIKTSEQIVVSATYSTDGLKDVKYVCKFCKHETVIQETIQMRKYAYSDSDSGGSSGGSYGGGSSGGGGSTSRW